TEGRDERLDLGVRQCLVQSRPLDVQDLAAQGEDRLGARVATANRRATRRVTLDDVDLALFGVVRLAVPQLSRHSAAAQDALASSCLTGLARGHPSLRGLDRLADHVAGLVGVRVEPVDELLTN